MDSTRQAVTIATAAMLGAVALVVLGIATTMRVGVLAMAAYLLAGAVARLTLPASRALVVRHRLLDAVVLLAGALALGYLGLTTALD